MNVCAAEDSSRNHSGAVPMERRGRLRARDKGSIPVPKVQTAGDETADSRIHAPEKAGPVLETERRNSLKKYLLESGFAC